LNFSIADVRERVLVMVLYAGGGFLVGGGRFSKPTRGSGGGGQREMIVSYVWKVNLAEGEKRGTIKKGILTLGEKANKVSHKKTGGRRCGISIITVAVYLVERMGVRGGNCIEGPSAKKVNQKSLLKWENHGSGISARRVLRGAYRWVIEKPGKIERKGKRGGGEKILQGRRGRGGHGGQGGERRGWMGGRGGYWGVWKRGYTTSELSISWAWGGCETKCTIR